MLSRGSARETRACTTRRSLPISQKSCHLPQCSRRIGLRKLSSDHASTPVNDVGFEAAH